MITIVIILTLLLSGCLIPGTYYDPFDEYVRGIRFFDRGDVERARVRWERLAKEGDCDAQFRLGTLYFLGTGVPQSYEVAYKWFLTAANQGQANAQGLLATMHAHDVAHGGSHVKTIRFDCSHGCGLEKNLVDAYKWARLAERVAAYEATREAAKNLADRKSVV